MVQVLQGSQAQDIRNTHLPRLSTYGIMKGSPREVIHAYLEALVGAGCIDVVGDEYPKLQITEFGEQVMRRRTTVRLPLQPSPPSSVPAMPRQDAAAPGGDLRMPPGAVPSLQPGVLAPDGDPDGDPVLLQRLQCAAQGRWRKARRCQPTPSHTTAPCGSWRSVGRPIARASCRFTASARRRLANTATLCWTRSALTWPPDGRMLSRDAHPQRPHDPAGAGGLSTRIFPIATLPGSASVMISPAPDRPGLRLQPVDFPR